MLSFLVNRHGALFDRQSAIKLSGMSEKAYNRSFNLLQNGLGVKWVLFLFVYLVSFIYNVMVIVAETELGFEGTTWM